MLSCMVGVIIERESTVKDLIESLKNYISVVLGIKIHLLSWKKTENLPFFLINTYEFYETTLLNEKYLFVVNKGNADLTPATIKIHLEQIQNKSGKMCVFIQKTTTSYNRKRLIEHRIPFIIPGNQMYFPEAGIDLREHFRDLKKHKDIVSPATQAVLVNALLSGIGGVFTLSELANKLCYTLMTMSRVFDELENLGIGFVSRKGKERMLEFKESRKELWEKSRKVMRDPVKHRIWATNGEPKVLAGLSALSEKSQLVSPNISTYAISLKEWKTNNFKELPNQEGATFELEVWHYDPLLFANNGLVDPYSLYLSLQENKDERVEAALEEMMEKEQ